MPGLPLALRWKATTWVLLDGMERRARALDAAVGALGLDGRVAVHHDRAEAAGRDTTLRGAFDLVVARAFGPPAVTAECGVPFLRVGGRLAVSEPPGDDPGRWPADGLALLGSVPEAPRRVGQAAVQVLIQTDSCPDRYPRRVGVPAKRPLF